MQDVFLGNTRVAQGLLHGFPGTFSGSDMFIYTPYSARISPEISHTFMGIYMGGTHEYFVHEILLL